MKKITLQFYSLIPRPGIQKMPWETDAETVRGLLHEIQENPAVRLTTNISKASVNNEFVEWDVPFSDGDRVTFLPPFSGG